MQRLYFYLITCLLCPVLAFSQADVVEQTDSIISDQLEEIVIVQQSSLTDNVTKPLSTIDHYLENSSGVNMIKRGAYAWEPYLNGMSSERSVVTIDGMRIYAACTDKMDPVTSYIEISNLAKASIHGGSAGAAGGATIAGSLDLERKKGSFGAMDFGGMAFSGYEFNNRQKVIGGALSYTGPKFFTDIDFTYRSAGNYRAGGNKEILYSQFTKYNASVISGYRIDAHRQVEASLIYDQANNVGYPALTMDVSSARALIGSLAYYRHHISEVIQMWESKIYYNNVAHVMDDTKRPVVPIRMDMPGWSNTAGFYSRLNGLSGRNRWKAILSGHFNKSLAEMTMFSNSPGEKDMFMLTWPGVHTYYGDFFVENSITISKKTEAILSAGLAIHSNQISKQDGLESLRIFYPDLSKSKTRMLKRLSSSLQFSDGDWRYQLGLAYGERAPSISEGYGFYLFNSFDRFDYIGNPDMKNEQSGSINGNVSFSRSALSIKLAGSYYHILDYIIGIPAEHLSAMTIGAAGVRMYEQLSYATILNSSLDFSYQVHKYLLWSNKLIYRKGTGKGVGNLPLVQPFTYSSTLAVSVKSFSGHISVNGAAKHQNYNPSFGETGLPAYSILNLSLSHNWIRRAHKLILKAGVENLFDKHYVTFADWNRIPRMGRNFYCNVIWSF